MKILGTVLALAVLLASVQSYEVEEEVLVLHDADFPNILEEFNYILIEFYAPWCGHCQRLQPAYTAAAKALAEKGSKIKLAKVDATKDPTSAADYGVSGYPTIFFFINGTKMDFNGDRSEAAIVAWVEKKILPATSDINSQAEVDKLAGDGSVSLVLYSSDAKDVSAFGLLAATDDYNRYYIAAGELLSKYSETTVEIIRGFGGVLTFKGVGDKFAAWVGKHSRPLVLEFDDRTIKDIFQKQKSSVILFNKDNTEALKTKLSDASEKSDGQILFVELTPENEHYDRFAEFIKLDVTTPKLIALKSSEQKKAVYSGDLSALTSEDVSIFAQDLAADRLDLQGMQEEGEQGAEEADGQEAEGQEAEGQEAGNEDL